MNFAGFVSVLVAATCCCSDVQGRHQKSVPIEEIYSHFSGVRSGIMVYEEDLRPVRGYAIDPFRRPNTDRNHFRKRRTSQKIKFLVLHLTESFSSEPAVKLFTENTTHKQTSAHYVIVKPNEADEHKQLLRVNVWGGEASGWLFQNALEWCLPVRIILCPKKIRWYLSEFIHVHFHVEFYFYREQFFSNFFFSSPAGTSHDFINVTFVDYKLFWTLK